MAESSRSNQTEQMDLFSRAGQFRIVEIKGEDAKSWSDHVKALRNLLSANQSMYPNIDDWFKLKVLPGLKSSERIAYVAYENEKPIASAILKRGDKSKFCHLRIHQDFQDRDLGQIFFAQMTCAVRHHAKEIHFTLPESLWYARNEFFKSFGFESAKKAYKQYRSGDTELSCSAPIQTVWSAAMQKMPNLINKFSVGGFSLNSDLVISIRPRFVEQIFSGIKTVEIRRKFSKKWFGARAVLYASKPISGLVGEARIGSITCGRPADIWLRFESEIGCSPAEFQEYTACSDEICAIELTEVRPYQAPLFLSQISHILKEDIRPPQSYSEVSLTKGGSWARALSVATLLHGKFGVPRSRVPLIDGKESPSLFRIISEREPVGSNP